MQTTEVVMDEPEDPLLVSERSGAAVSMPGMMDTVLNLGLNGIAVEGLARRAGDERFARDSYRRFIQVFGDIVIKIDPDKFETSQAYRKHEAARPDPMGGYSPSTSLPQFVRAVFFKKHPEVQLVVRGIRFYSLGRASSDTTGSTWGRLVEMYVSGAIVVQ